MCSCPVLGLWITESAISFEYPYCTFLALLFECHNTVKRTAKLREYRNTYIYIYIQCFVITMREECYGEMNRGEGRERTTGSLSFFFSFFDLLSYGCNRYSPFVRNTSLALFLLPSALVRCRSTHGVGHQVFHPLLQFFRQANAIIPQ